ncbi:MAG: carbohydrate-binding domain-containing protein [Synergistaceae bacterium]|nr:carbohydrate-binding domain-containing protein [Synergistaceae bacterium]
MKKFSRIIYLMFLAVMVLSLSGCGSDDDEPYYGPDTQRLIVLSSRIFNVNEGYRIYRGDQVVAWNYEEGKRVSSKYYVAPEAGTDFVTMNLQFRDPISPDVPMIIIRSDDERQVLFCYNPDGTGIDTTTPFGDIILWGGLHQQLKYSGFGVSGASVMPAAVDIDTSDEIVVILDAEAETAKINSFDVDEYNYVWHADPNHRTEYFTKGINGTQELSEAEMLSEIQESIEESEGVYIARDIRYTPNNINFTSTAKKDEDTEFVAYYSDEISSQAAAELGSGFEGPYIFATLPNNRKQQQPPSAQVAASDVVNTDIDAFATMTHSAQDAYDNPVLHIVKSGTYRLKGTWHGQIWVEVGENEDDKVALILDGVEISCDVAPAVVFKEVYECGPTSNIVSFDVAENMHNTTQTNAGAIVIIASGSTNKITGSNVYRILQADKKNASTTKIDGSDISDQKKLYKMDGAFYSFMSMVIGAEENRGGGRLNITSTTYEGLGSEMHLLVDSGIIKVTAEDDGINVNKDDTSVFTMDAGSLTVVSKNGDGIDSNGYIIINNGTLDITAAQDSDQLNAQAEGPLDADLGVYMGENVTYTHQAYNGNTGDDDTDTDSSTGSKAPVTIKDENGTVLFRINYTTPFHDEEDTQREAAGESEVFLLEHKVNNFGDVRIR